MRPPDGNVGGQGKQRRPVLAAGYWQKVAGLPKLLWKDGPGVGSHVATLLEDTCGEIEVLPRTRWG